MSEKFYKIQDKVSGLYALSPGKFNKNGRIWRNLSSLRSYMHYKKASDFKNCGIVEFTLEKVAIYSIEFGLKSTET